MTTRTASLVRQIRLNIELPRYSCRSCRYCESAVRKSQHSSIFEAAILKLFIVLSAWKPRGRLVLELNAFSPSDSEHWFKALDAQIYEESEQQQQQETLARWHDPKHSWIDGRQVEGPPAEAMEHLFAPICLGLLPGSIPEVHAVTRLVIRRECRRQVLPSILRLLVQKLPRLQHVTYEPWRYCRRGWKITCDNGMLKSQLFDRRPNH